MDREADSNLHLTVARNLRHLRRISGMKQAEVAEKLGWKKKKPEDKDNQSMVSQIEGGHVGVSLETVRKLAGVFRVPAADLLRLDLKDYYPDPASIPEVKQRELGNPDEAISGIAPRPFRKKKVFRFSDLMEALGPSNAEFPIPSVKFHLPDWLEGRNLSKLVCAVIDDESKAPGFKKGDMICIDMNDIPAADEREGIGYYVVKGFRRFFICRGEKAGFTLELLDVPIYVGKTPLFIDLRLDQKPVVGRVVWSLRFS